VPPDVEIHQSQLLQTDADFRERLVRIHEEFEPARAEAVHLEQVIHAGFASRPDETRMASFHQLDWAGREGLLREFEDARFRQLAQRLVFEAAPEMLAPEDRERVRQAIAKRLWTEHEDNELWRSLPAARREMDEVRKDGSGNVLVGEFDAWIEGLEARFTLDGCE
jgi:exodeoxyribonuclease I